jgi:hypothetical protein
MSQLSNTHPHIYPQHLEQVAVQILTSTEEKKNYKVEDALEVAMVVIASMSREMYSPNAMYLAFSSARASRPPHISEEDYN